MFEALNRLFARPETVPDRDDPQVAVAALLVHLAAVDGETSPQERAAVKSVLQERYGLGETAVNNLVRQGTSRSAEAVDLYHFTAALSGLDSQERIEIIRMMWQVVFADQKNHELEDNMVWRIAELIGVSARERTILRSQIGKTRPQ